MMRVNFLEQPRAFFQMEVGVLGLDANEKAVRRRVRESRNVENRMIRLRQFVQREHAENRGERCPENGQLKGDGNKSRPAIERTSSNILGIGDRRDPVLEEKTSDAPGQAAEKGNRRHHVALQSERFRETLDRKGSIGLEALEARGSDLLDGAFEVQSGACDVTVDDRYDPVTNPLTPGATGRWPLVPGKLGAFDLSRPSGSIAAQAYLQNFDSPWMSIRRLDGFVAAALSWDDAVFPCAWLWYELGGTAEPPWCGETRLIGLEPNTTWPGTGLADADRRGGRLMTLQPGAEITATVRLHVFKPEGAVLGVDASGRAVLTPAR